MKEDILEQLVDEYLMHRGYFTMHNVKFKPKKDHPEYIREKDSVASDIDVIGIHPKLRGKKRVIVVSCKSWQGGFDAAATLRRIAGNQKSGGREEWKKYRELCVGKWTSAFFDAVEEATGTTSFTYWTAVTTLAGPYGKHVWEDHQPFCAALRGNPIQVKTLSEMLAEVWGVLSKTPAATELGRVLQVIKASGWKP